MKIMVSACLAGENCKYNGGNNRNKKVEALFDGNEIHPFAQKLWAVYLRPEPLLRLRMVS